MRFILLLKADEKAEAGPMSDEKILAAMRQYNDALAKAGVLLAAERLHPSSKGTRMRISFGKRTVTDGPFASAKELIAGVWLIQVQSKEQAIEWASRFPFEAAGPSAMSGGAGQIEVRQVTELSDFPINDDESGWRERQAEFRAVVEGPPSVETVRKPEPEGKATMRFMMMFKADQNSEAGIPPSEKLLTEMGNLMDEMVKSGVLLAGEGLRPSSKAARITFSGGKRTVTDGPFTETKELIAGYSLIQVKSKEEAIEWALRSLAIDAEGRGGESEIEIRLVFD